MNDIAIPITTTGDEGCQGIKVKTTWCGNMDGAIKTSSFHGSERFGDKSFSYSSDSFIKVGWGPGILLVLKGI
jgi:hypothetical protein